MSAVISDAISKASAIAAGDSDAARSLVVQRVVQFDKRLPPVLAIVSRIPEDDARLLEPVSACLANVRHRGSSRQCCGDSVPFEERALAEAAILSIDTPIRLAVADRSHCLLRQTVRICLVVSPQFGMAAPFTY